MRCCYFYICPKKEFISNNATNLLSRFFSLRNARRGENRFLLITDRSRMQHLHLFQQAGVNFSPALLPNGKAAVVVADEPIIYAAQHNIGIVCLENAIKRGVLPITRDNMRGTKMNVLFIGPKELTNFVGALPGGSFVRNFDVINSSSLKWDNPFTGTNFRVLFVMTLLQRGSESILQIYIIWSLMRQIGGWQ